MRPLLILFLLSYLLSTSNCFLIISTTMPVTRRKTTKLQQKVSIEETTPVSDEAAVQLQDNFPHPASPMASAARSKKKFRHKRNRSINRATIPLGVSAKIPKHEEASPTAATAGGSGSEGATTTTTAQTLWTTQTKSPTTTPRERVYSIRPMKMQDVAPVYHLGNVIFTASEYPNMYRTWDDFAVVENYEGSSEFCFVVEKVAHDDDDGNEGESANNNKDIIGFLLGETVTKAALETRGYIQWVAVLPPYRRMGIATSLIQQFTQVAQEQDVTLLIADTPADNEPAIRMFEKAGLCYKTDHVYLTCQLRDVELAHVDEDMAFNYMYTAKKKRITIRNMEIDDLYPIHAIGEDIFTKKTANLYNFWDEHLVLQSYLSDPEFCAVATVREHDKDKVVGFAFGTTIEKPRSSWKYGYLVWLGCAREYQGMGLASQLYIVMLELFSMEKVRMVMIDTQHNNEGALHFFRKVGFGHDEDHVYLSNAPMDDSK